jgi:hypothetical protein
MSSPDWYLLVDKHHKDDRLGAQSTTFCVLGRERGLVSSRIVKSAVLHLAVYAASLVIRNIESTQ